MMTHSLGVYYAPEHARQSDRDYMAALQPPVIRLLDPDVQQIADLHALCPNATIAPRTWAIDDNGGQAVRDLMADPIGTGQKHANAYRAQLLQWQSEAMQRGLPFPSTDRLIFNAANEPNQGGTPDKIAAYNLAFLEMCRINGLRAAALCLGVGWPDNTGPDTPVNWQPYAELENVIRRGNHWLDLHEYHYKTGPQDGWRWLAGRHLQCPFDVPILLGEIGVDNYVDKTRWDREGGNRGWQGNVSPDVYAEMIEYHISHADRRVVAALPFITDFRNREWQSFDTGPAHNALLARKDRMIPQAVPSAAPAPSTVHLPTVSTGPQPVTEPPVGDTWARSIEWILRWEGGFQNNPADVGNYYNNQLIGTKYGISAASWGGQYDIPNLTLEQAKQIYYTHYWQASGADALPWPAALLVMDTAVLHGVGTARAWLTEVGANPLAFAAKRLHVYTQLSNFDEFGRGWVNRTADLLQECAK